MDDATKAMFIELLDALQSTSELLADFEDGHPVRFQDAEATLKANRELAHRVKVFMYPEMASNDIGPLFG